MASLEQQLKLLTEEIAQLNSKLDDVSEKIDDEMCKAESAQNPALLGRLTKKEERLLAEKDELVKVRSKLLTGGQVAASSAAVPTAAAPSVAAPPVAPMAAAPPVAPIAAATNPFFALGRRLAKDPCHPHPFEHSSFSEDRNRVCDICHLAYKKETAYCGYVCKGCDYSAHIECLSSPVEVEAWTNELEEQYLTETFGPSAVTDPCHPHALSRTALVVQGAFCDICHLGFDKKDGYYGYLCAMCDYATHVKCLTSPKDAPRRDELSDIKCHKERGGLGAPEEAEQKPVDSRTVLDPCHPHVLKCCSDGVSLCDICKSTIDAGCDKFCCRDCDFDVHFSCLTVDLGLPPKLTDVRHPHGLTLHPRAKRGDLQGRYACAGCKDIGRTWVYECDEAECDFKLHPLCPLVEVKGHSAFGHWLALEFAEKSACALPECALKGTRSYVLRCCVADWKEGATCDLFLHVDCANKIAAPHAPQRVAETLAAIKAAQEAAESRKEAAEAHMKELQLVQLQRQNQQMASLSSSLSSLHNQTMNNMNFNRLERMRGWRSVGL